jgi:hypothetical protein
MMSASASRCLGEVTGDGDVSIEDRIEAFDTGEQRPGQFDRREFVALDERGCLSDG